MYQVIKLKSEKMTPNGLKNQLIWFLRKNGALSEFMREFEEHSQFASVIEMCDAVKWYEIFKYCFTWNNTTNGRSFWARLDKLWVNGNPMSYCDKPDDYMMTYSIGQVIDAGEDGMIEVREAVDCTCKGCVFSVHSVDCGNKHRYSCTPYSRGDAKQVIFKKIE